MDFLKRIFYPAQDTRTSIGLLLVRLVAGAAFMQHGSGKISNPFHWMDSMNPSMPGFLQMLAALAEFGGGIAWFFGALFPLFTFLLFCTMVVATQTTLSMGAVFVSNENKLNYELSAVYLVVAILFALTGPGRFSIDYLLLHRAKRAVPAADPQ